MFLWFPLRVVIVIWACYDGCFGFGVYRAGFYAFVRNMTAWRLRSRLMLGTVLFRSFYGNVLWVFVALIWLAVYCDCCALIRWV